MLRNFWKCILMGRKKKHSFLSFIDRNYNWKLNSWNQHIRKLLHYQNQSYRSSAKYTNHRPRLYKPILTNYWSSITRKLNVSYCVSCVLTVPILLYIHITYSNIGIRRCHNPKRPSVQDFLLWRMVSFIFKTKQTKKKTLKHQKLHNALLYNIAKSHVVCECCAAERILYIEYFPKIREYNNAVTCCLVYFFFLSFRICLL